VQFADLKAEQLFELQSKYMVLLGTIRTYAVNLVDSFDIQDEALGSVLGCWDGNAYQRLFDEASKSPLNKTTVHRESFEKYLKPLMKSNL
jgi:acyl-CoA oxidase